MTNPLIAARDAFSAIHPETRDVVNGRDWGVIEAGSGPTLLLIPGTLGRADVFWQQIEALSPHLRIIAVSYPDSGGVAKWSDDLATLLTRRGVDRFAVLGSSLGGYLAQYLAATHAPRITQLFAANTLHSVAGLDQRPPYSSDLVRGPIAELRAGFGTGLEAWAKAHPDQADLVDLLMAEVGGRILEPELRARLSALKNGPELPPLDLDPDLIVTIEADDDPLIPPELRAAVRARLRPGVAYRFLWGGHFPYVVRPAVYTALIAQVMNLPVSGADWGTGTERSL